MTFLNWITISTVIDISTIVFFVATVYKIRKIKSELQRIQSDLNITMKNPQAAKRLLKQRQQKKNKKHGSQRLHSEKRKVVLGQLFKQRKNCYRTSAAPSGGHGWLMTFPFSSNHSFAAGYPPFVLIRKPKRAR